MFNRVLAPFAVSLAIAPMLSLSAAVVNPCGSVAIAARTYGTDGEDGADGRSGANGTDGVNQTVEAGDRLMRLDFSGEDGGNGESGERGGRGRCRDHNRPDTDVRAANGGDGGDGGPGGSGGDGGNVTVYYRDREQLRNLAVNAAGGQGGRGGRGKRGGQGCNCNEYSWSETTCTDGNCETENFSCKDGEDGDDGSRGADGRDGQIGRARIVDQTLLTGSRVERDAPRMESAIANMSAAPVELSRNLWQTRTGARSLFNNNSVIDDTYEAYAGRVEKRFQLVWDADYPQAQASGALAVSINDGGEIDIAAPEDLWIDGDRTEEGDLTTYRVRYALLAADAVDLSVGRQDGRGEQFALSVLDLAGKSDVVETQIHVRYKTKSDDRRSRYITRYDDALPADLLSQEYNRFVLDIGQLPIDKKYLRRNTEARVEITITRRLADNEATTVLEWNGSL